ncbi:hypothetical protein BKA62DRAFT_677446 [Auriculariales sp. MPI-PUGE-AT-0066]|nr:hypothetical protein BKA62DRAFT_677446 [Auriculariales sp. MPI-PUGE-AT-0066]
MHIRSLQRHDLKGFQKEVDKARQHELKKSQTATSKRETMAGEDVRGRVGSRQWQQGRKTISQADRDSHQVAPRPSIAWPATKSNPSPPIRSKHRGYMPPKAPQRHKVPPVAKLGAPVLFSDIHDFLACDALPRKKNVPWQPSAESNTLIRKLPSPKLPPDPARIPVTLSTI